MKRAAVGVVVATIALATTAATAAPTVAGSTRASAANATGTVNIGFAINKFVKQGKNLVANGTATMTYTDSTGANYSSSQPFTAKVITRGIRGVTAASRTCSVLTLQLDQLNLTLLGLTVHLDKVIITIKADSNGGILGSLFCSLANAKVKLRSLATVARRLTHVAHASGLSTMSSGLGFTVPLTSKTAEQTAPCQILDLILGPLHLNLLGLIVDLNQVHLTITADPAGGLLGSLLCSLAHTQVP